MKPGSKSKLMTKASIITGYSCNNNCRFCYDSEKRHIPELTTEEVKARIAQAKGCEQIVFLGGEFTLRKDAVELISFAHQMGFRTISVTTNGRAFSYDALLKKYIAAGLNSVIFSIHGHDAELHDFQTQVPGSFGQLMKGIENAQKNNISIGTNTVVSNLNYRELGQIARFLVSLGIRNAEFIYIDPTTGEGRRNFKELVPEIDVCAPYIKECLDIGIKNNIAHWQIRYYPLCFLPGYEKYISENSALKEIHLGPEFSNYDVKESRKKIGRMKTSQCKVCVLAANCEGFWRPAVVEKFNS